MTLKLSEHRQAWSGHMYTRYQGSSDPPCRDSEVTVSSYSIPVDPNELHFEQRSPRMQTFAQTLIDTVTTLETEASATIENVKTKTQVKECSSPDQQRFTPADKQLEDRRSPLDSNTQKELIPHLFFRLRRGMQTGIKTGTEKPGTLRAEAPVQGKSRSLDCLTMGNAHIRPHTA